MRRRIAGAVLAGGLAVMTYASTAAARTPDARTAPLALRAGAARVEIRVPEGAPLAGYGAWRRRLPFPDVFGLYPHAFWFRPSQGALDALAARALVLYAGDTRVTWIAADLIAVTQDFTRRISERLAANGIRAGSLIVSASHTHSGPGGFLAAPTFAVTATDREAPAVRDAVLDAIVEAVRRAGAGARDANLAVGRADVPDMTRGRLGYDPDPAVIVLVFTSTAAERIAVVWNYAIHPTMLGPGNDRLSGDVTGAVSRTLETALGVPVLYVNGAVGDVSPRRHGHDAVREGGDAIAAVVQRTIGASRPAGSLPLVVRSARVTLPPPALSLRHCAHSWFPGWARVPLGAVLPDVTELLGVALGSVALVTIPGEATSGLGREIRTAAAGRWSTVLVAGVSNDYLGYFVRPEEYARPGYVTCATVYGPRVGRCVAATASALLGRLPEPGPLVTGASPECDRP